MTAPYSPKAIHAKAKICFNICMLIAIHSLSASPAFAIPSPELVLGSVSALSQIAAFVFAGLSALGAIIATRLGIQKQNKKTRYPFKLIGSLTLALVVLALGNHWQWSQHRAMEQERLQATLVRPAQFDGTVIKDQQLKETSYVNQTHHPQAITTSQAAQLLQQGDVHFFDIRETAENAMGTLPGATHIRYPDFRQSPPVNAGDKVVLFCHNGNRSSETCAQLAALGIDCSFIAGGIEKWIVEGRSFSDESVKALEDLRAIPDYPNKDTLLDTERFRELAEGDALQIIDTRYPGDFGSGHLPGAINIPLRAMTTKQLASSVALLEKIPTVAACYDRRSCFMAQVLGLELTQKGIPFEGRYTVPWEFFIAPPQKPHMEAWLAEQQGPWQKAIDALAELLIWGHNRSDILFSLLILALASRIAVLPIALKSERDQITLSLHKPELMKLKAELSDDPVRKTRAIKDFYQRHELTPMRNMLALAFLPLTMLGVSATEQAAGSIVEPFLWISDLGAPDPSFVAPSLVCLAGAVYLFWAIAKTARQSFLWMALGMPTLFLLTVNLSAAANLYITMSLSLLLLQRLYLTGLPSLGTFRWHRLPEGAFMLDDTTQLANSGNKALRLSKMRTEAIPVPNGVVLTQRYLDHLANSRAEQRSARNRKIWRAIGPAPCAVRSSASNEDGADQSFAGVFDSVLDVDRDTLDKAIDTVAASFDTEQARSYGGKPSGDGNILIQTMIPAEYAGVLFTQDPRAPGLTMLEWVEGSGDDLVSGRKTPYALRIGRLSREIHEGDITPTFDLHELLELGQRIETLFGTPQDIEWAWTGGKFYILQSRDITTLALGSNDEQLRVSEWERILAPLHDQTTSGNAVVLEQDEVSELLPRPTPLSFALMAELWAPGGSLDLACRAIGLPYRLPEGKSAHLQTLFGKTYVNKALKTKLTLDLSGGREKRMERLLETQRDALKQNILPKLQDQLEDLRALDYAALSSRKLVATIQRLRSSFVHDVYSEVEKVNLLAAFAMERAMQAAQGDTAIRSHLMRAELPHSPSSILADCAAAGDKAEEQALQKMGHRALFDYELSTPRYNEAPSLLFTLLKPSLGTIGAPATLHALPEKLKSIVDAAIAYQDLKEQAKHESLKLLAELRRAIKALGKQSGLDDHIFYLTLDEIAEGDWLEPQALRALAEQRANESESMKSFAPEETSLTLVDCERLSLGSLLEQQDGDLVGTCVSGNGSVTGRVFVVEDEALVGEAAFSGFEPGDIIVCKMVNPGWVNEIQQAGAVLSNVGGWLSHMAIIAREKQVMMLVGCKALNTLSNGQLVTVHEDGSINPSYTPDQSPLSA